MHGRVHRASFIIVLVGSCCVAKAQYDVGVSVGLYRQWLREAPGGDDHYFGSYDDYQNPSLSAGFIYRETSAPHVNFAGELRFLRRSFRVNQGYGGLGGSNSQSIHADLDLLYINILPEVRLDGKGLAVLNFGPMIGVLLGGRVTGSAYDHVGGTIETTTFQNAPPTMFKGDLRFAFGFGLREVSVKTVALSMDAGFNLAFASLLKDKPGSRGSDLELRVAMSRRVQRKALFHRGSKTAK